MVTEYAKDKVWEESKETFNNQAYIFGKQYFRISRCEDKVDVIVTDSPLLLSILYNKTEILGKEFDALVSKVFNSYHSLNYLLERNKPYNPIGRFQTEEESNALAAPMKELLAKYDVEYKTCKGCVEDYDRIVFDVLTELNSKDSISKDFYILLLREGLCGYDINICEYCEHYIPCLGKECEKYISGIGDVEGKSPDWKWSCEDFDFGECPMLENTPCNGCYLESNFSWNGKKYEGK